MFNVLVGFCVSIIGDSPVTVTLSCTVLSVISMSTVNVLPARMRRPSRRYAAKPASSAATV
jgi:hypothetical protein